MRQSLETLAKKYWPYPVLAAIMVWMLWTRVQGYQALIVGGKPMFSGVDPWYQFRTVMYTVKHWPATIPFEIWSGYPTGALKGQFGTLFDQIIATVALILYGGNPTPTEVRYVLFFAPPVLGALTALPVYYIARVVTGKRLTAVLATVLLSLFSGQFYTRTTVSFSEHNAAEPFTMAVAIAAFLWMLKHEQADTKPTGLANDEARYRRLYRRALVAGVALAVYLAVWPPAIVLVGIIGLFVAVYGLIVAPYMGRETTAFFRPIGMALLVTGLLMTLLFETTRVTVVAYGPLQVLFPIGVGLVTLAIPFVEEVRKDEDLDWYVTTVAAGFVGAVSITVGFLVAPDAMGEVFDNVGEVFGLGLFAGSRATIAEAQPTWSFQAIYQFYGIVMFVAILVLPETFVRSVTNEDWPQLFAAFWAFMLLIMAISQIRFHYYFALAVAVFGAHMIQRSVAVFELDRNIRDYDREQAFMAIGIIGAVSLSLVGPVASNVVYQPQTQQPTVADNWRGVTTWMQENTPAEGQLGMPEQEALDYYGTYSEADDYNYPNGTYGVVSPWTAGHFVTVFGKRIPTSNPFQQHVSSTAQFIYANEEERAMTVFEEELNAEHTERYAVISWGLVTPNSPAYESQLSYHPTLDADSFSRQIVERPNAAIDKGNVTFLKNQSYYETMAVRMYQYHGSRVPESNVVVRWNETNGQLTPPDDEPFIETVSSPSEADRLAAENPQTSDGGIGIYAPEPVPALEHYRMVRASERQASENAFYRAFISTQRNLTGLPTGAYYNDPRQSKVFERVPGATIRGTAEPNSTVNATVWMRTSTGTTFRYTQHAQTDANGRFSMTVPYSTTGYDNWGPERGYTNVSTRATGPYELQTDQCEAEVAVSEAAVIGEDTGPSEVSLCD